MKHQTSIREVQNNKLIFQIQQEYLEISFETMV